MPEKKVAELKESYFLYLRKRYGFVWFRDNERELDKIWNELVNAGLMNKF